MRPAQLCFFRCIGHLLQRSQEAPNRRWHGVRLSVTKVFGDQDQIFFFCGRPLFFFISSLHILKANGFIYWYHMVHIFSSINYNGFYNGFHIFPYIYIYSFTGQWFYLGWIETCGVPCVRKKHPYRCIPGCHEWPIIWVKRTQKAEHVDCFDCQQSVFVEYT